MVDEKVAGITSSTYHTDQHTNKFLFLQLIYKVFIINCYILIHLQQIKMKYEKFCNKIS